MGSYAVLGRAEGQDINGQHFALYTSASFYLAPRVLYVYTSDPGTGTAYKELLEGNGLSVDVVHVSGVPELALQQDYQLIIVGPETGDGSSWGTPAALSAIINSEVPVLGLGEGGYAYFGKISYTIGYPNGAHSSGTSIEWGLASDQIWRNPYDVDRSSAALQLYNASNGRVDIYLSGEGSLEVFGTYPGDPNYADLVMENEFHTLWGFVAGPATMTDLGKQVFVNTAYRTMR